LVCDIEHSAHCANHNSYQQENISAIEVRLPHIVGNGVGICRLDYSAAEQLVEIGTDGAVLAEFLEFGEARQNS